MIDSFAVISLWAEDVATTVHFYVEVLGLELLPHHQARFPHLKVGGTFLTILKGKPQPPVNPDPDRFPLVAFRVRDLDLAVARLQDHGVDLPWGVEGQRESRWVMFYDPAGNLIELT